MRERYSSGVSDVNREMTAIMVDAHRNNTRVHDVVNERRIRVWFRLHHNSADRHSADRRRLCHRQCIAA